jgi:hypothetical protein
MELYTLMWLAYCILAPIVSYFVIPELAEIYMSYQNTFTYEDRVSGTALFDAFLFLIIIAIIVGLTVLMPIGSVLMWLTQ